MTEEESPSVFGGLADLAEAAWDAQTNVTEAVVDTAIGASEFGAGVGAHFLATGAELVGATETRDALDNVTVESIGDAVDSWESAGQNLGEAYTDVVGE